MKRRSLGALLPAVSAVGYGGMHLSIVDRPPDEQGIRVIHAALDAGVTLIDTADAYCLDESETGHNERLIARALATWPGPRDAVLVATKGGIVRTAGGWERNGSPAHLRQACERSLRALRVERIALYQLHAPDPNVPFAESVGALAELRQQGKIGAAGLSNVSVAQIAEAEGIVPVAAVQNRLNPYFREALTDGVIAHCMRRRIGFLAYSPTGGGRLTRKLPSHPVLAPRAARLGVTAHQLVLAWVLAQGPLVVPIPSARTVAHVESSAAAAALELGPADRAAINDAVFDRS